MNELREYIQGTELFKSGIPARCFLCHRNVKSHSFIGFRKTVSGDYICFVCDTECDEYELKRGGTAIMKISDESLKRLIDMVKMNTGQNVQEWDETYSALLELAGYREAEQDGRLVVLTKPDKEKADMTCQEAAARIADHARIHFKNEYPRAQLITQALNMAIKSLNEKGAHEAALQRDKTELEDESC